MSPTKKRKPATSTVSVSAREAVASSAQGGEAIAKYVSHLAEFDEALRRYNFHPHRLQPFHDGRITLEWINKNGREAEVPVPACWVFHKKTGLWSWDKLPVANLPRRNRRSRAFHDTAKVVSAILSRVKELLEVRAGTVKRFNDFRDAVEKSVAYRRPLLEDVDHELHVYDRGHASLVHHFDGAEWPDDGRLVDE